jgi:DNA-binding MarR family transcriptional regulator
MSKQSNNVNKTDINLPGGPDPDIPLDVLPLDVLPLDDLPLDVMGLFYFAYRDFVGDADSLLAHQGFGRAHHRVLYFVNLRPGMPVADLLDVLRITKQSLARVLRQLIGEGYVVQKTGAEDRRQRLLYPTEKGSAFFRTLSATQADRINAALADLPPDGRRTIEAFFVAMVEPGDHKRLEALRLIGKKPGRTPPK